MDLMLRLALAVALTLTMTSPANAYYAFSRRGFLEIKCGGTYDSARFARLDRVCEDCYILMRAPQLYTLCRKDCFSTEYFKSCVETLYETDQLELFKTYIIQLYGANVAFLQVSLISGYFGCGTYIPMRRMTFFFSFLFLMIQSHPKILGGRES